MRGRRGLGTALVVASLLFPLWLAWELSRTFVGDLGAQGLELVRWMVVALLGYAALMLVAIVTARRWLLLGASAAGAVAAIGLFWLVFEVGPLLRFGSLGMIAVQAIGIWMRRERSL